MRTAERLGRWGGARGKRPGRRLPALERARKLFARLSARLTEVITGATGWSLGISGSPDRYGSGIDVAPNSHAHGVTGSPLAYHGGSSLLLTAEGGSFTGGTVRLVAHYIELSPPRAV